MHIGERCLLSAEKQQKFNVTFSMNRKPEKVGLFTGPGGFWPDLLEAQEQC